MSSPFTPKKHNCLKDGVTRQELLETLQQIKLLKRKTATQINEFEKTISQQSEQICYLSNRIERADRQTEEAVRLKQQQMRQHEEELAQKDDEIEQLKEQISKLQKTLANTKWTVDESHTKLSQTIESVSKREEELARLKQQFIELGSCLGIGLMPSSESDEALLASVREHGGLRGILDKMKEEKLSSLEEKHALSDTIRKLEFELHKINNQKDFDDKVIAIRSKEVTGLEEAIGMLKENLSSQQNRINELEKLLSSKSTEYASLNEQLSIVENKLRNSETEKDDLLNQISELKQQILDKEQQLQTLTHQNTVLSKRSEYEELVGSVIDESEDYRRINSTLTTYSKFRVEYYRNVDKIQFLCELLDA